MRVFHILVTHRHEAEDLLRRLHQGVSFEELARKYSHCSSAKAGGDLGDLTGQLHRLDDAFAEAVRTLSPGEISPPTRTRFGWHLIRI